ncbi:MAG: hypothetical protein FWC62_04730 [Firmicutes bacterium]|nr:hypothetical protein [Bacillota bacterium]
MRRENSKFNAAFASFEGSKLFNNDYYGSAELDKFACYVAADGLEPGEIESASARVAVQAAIAAFHEHPSMSKNALNRYVRAAHAALRRNSRRVSMQASITVVVTNYQAVRYAWAGNTRFYLYRAGRLLHESLDHSLSQEMTSRGQLPVDRIARHQERNNLYLFAGQPGRVTPEVSKKIKLKDGDIFALLTRGVWECCDAGDIRAALDSAENDPRLAVEGLERLMLDPAPNEMDNYTAAVVFVDKIFIDPNKGKKLKKILMIAIPVAIVLIALLIVLLIIHNNRVSQRREMNANYLSAVEYVGDNNYPKASDDLASAIALANKLGDKASQTKIGNWQMLVDAVTNADKLFTSGDYAGAQMAYQTALDRSRFTDNAGQSYIQNRMTLVGNYLNVRDLIAQGDTLQAGGDYTGAENKYLLAQQLATGINDVDGRTQAAAALQSLYAAQDRANTQQQAADAKQQAADAQKTADMQAAADMEAAGDTAFQKGDLTGAKLYYQIALDRFKALSDSKSVDRINGKLQTLADAQAQHDAQSQTAAKYVSDGDKLYDAGNYVDAKVKYILARNIYSQLQDSVSLANVMAKIDLCDSKINAVTPSPSPSPSPSDSPSPSPSPDQTVTADVPSPTPTEGDPGQ